MNKKIKIILYAVIFLSSLSYLYPQTTISIYKKPYKTYRPVEGKIIGIWPHNDRFKSIEQIKELKDRWGFNYILLASIYGQEAKEMAEEAGFDSTHIFFQIIPTIYETNRLKFKQRIKELGKIGGYYFDEPISREYSFKTLTDIVIFLARNKYYPHAQFIMSELEISKGERLKRIANSVTYSGYGRPNIQGVDQIETWIEWKNNLGDQFSTPWIGTLEDSLEYDELFGAAEQLELKGVLLYALEPIEENKEASNNNYERFCEMAVKHGFMKVINK